MIVTRIRPPRPWSWGLEDFDQMRHDLARLSDIMNRVLFPDAGPRMFPLVNVTQDRDNLYVRAELPGVKLEDLDVCTIDRKVTISGKRGLNEEKEGVSYHRREREGGAFSRSIELPAAFDRDRVEAAFRSGILELRLPLSEETKPRQITVKGS